MVIDLDEMEEDFKNPESIESTHKVVPMEMTSLKNERDSIEIM